MVEELWRMGGLASQVQWQTIPLGAHHYMWCATPPLQKELLILWGRHTYAHLKRRVSYIQGGCLGFLNHQQHEPLNPGCFFLSGSKNNGVFMKYPLVN